MRIVLKIALKTRLQVSAFHAVDIAHVEHWTDGGEVRVPVRDVVPHLACHFYKTWSNLHASNIEGGKSHFSRSGREKEEERREGGRAEGWEGEMSGRCGRCGRDSRTAV